MTATATTARATVAAVLSSATSSLGVHVYDYEPGPGDALGATAAVVSHLNRERHMDRYQATLLFDAGMYTAATLADRAEQVTETVALGFETGLPASWQTGTWTFGYEDDATLYVARCELLLPVGDPSPATTGTVTISTLTMTTARAAIAAAAVTSLAGFTPTPVVHDYPAYPGMNAGPVVVTVAPLAIDRDLTWHQVAVLINGTVPVQTAQDWLDDLVVDLDDGLRTNLGAAYALLGATAETETGWDRVGWAEELECWAAQVAVGHFRGRW